MALRTALLVSLAAAAGASQTRLTPRAQVPTKLAATRRGAIATTVSTLALSFAAPFAAPAGAALVADLEQLGAEAKKLRALARDQGSRAAPALRKGLDATLNPLQAKMAAGATQGSDAYTQAQLMKGHLLELTQALEGNDFAEYVSKSTKATYPGGKVERELEEVSETFDDYLALVKPVWDGRYADPNHPRGYRDISVKGGVATIVGVDEANGPVWTLTAKVDGTSALIDFSPKGGPKDLLAKLAPGGLITFPDGNTWTRK